jgi:hypothetical protein
LIARPAYANSRKRRYRWGAEDALRSFCSGYRGSIILGHGHITLSAYREGLTYHVLSAEQGKSVSPPCGEVKPQGGSMVMRIAELRKSECCPVIGQIEVALPLGDHMTSLETEPTSRWYSNSRTFAEPINEATQMTTAQAVGAASHTRGGWYPLPCELAASPYRVGLICT